MNRIPVFRLSNEALVQELEESIAQDGPHTARQVALIGEVERRRLYAPAGYPSMYRYCVGKLHLSEDAAYKRIQVARVARRYPAVLAVLAALAEGRVHLTGLNLLAAHIKALEPAMVDELLAAATHKTKKDIEQLLAERFPKPDLPAQVHAIPPAPQPGPTSEPVVEVALPQLVANTASELAPAQVGDPVTPSHVECPRPDYASIAPLAPLRYGVEFTLDQAGHDLLQQVQDLLGHEVPRGDLAEVIVRALKAYAALLEKKKHAATENDHILEYARGGEATFGNIRLRCRAHNRLGAERTYGAGFMERKQAQAVERRASRRANSSAQTASSPPA